MAGRPKKQKAELREKPLRIRLTTDERERIDSAARAVGLLTAGWARMVLLRAAQEHSGAAVERPIKEG